MNKNTGKCNESQNLNKTNIKKERYYKLDNIKFILILLVVLGHFIDAFTNDSILYKGIYIYIYSFHMPLFIYISGIFARNKINNKSALKSKVINLIILGLISKIIITITLYLFTGIRQFSLLSDWNLPWYLFALALLYCCTYILKDKKFLPIFILSTLVSAFVGYDTTIGDYLYISRFLIFFPFFWCGYKLDINKIICFLERKYVKVISIFVLLLGAVICFTFTKEIYFMRGIFTGRNSFFFITKTLYNGHFIRLFAYLVSFCMCGALISLIPNKIIPMVTKNGSRTISVYLWHFTFLELLLYLKIPNILMLQNFIDWKIIWIIISIISTFVLSNSYLYNFTKKIITYFEDRNNI